MATAFSSSFATDQALKDKLFLVHKALSENGQETISFREKRQSKVLLEPLEFEGYLYYDTKSGAMRKVLLPSGAQDETVEMEFSQDALFVKRGKRQRRVSFRSRPELKSIYATFRALLDGDVASLEAHFDLSYIQRESEWEIKMLPKAKRVAKRLQSFTIEGEADLPRHLTTRMLNGDWQRMTFLQ